MSRYSKVFKWFVLGLLYLICIGIPYIGTKIMDIPDVVSIIVLIFGSIFTKYLVITYKKLAFKIIQVVVSLIFLLLLTYGAFCFPYMNTISRRKVDITAKSQDTILTKKEAIEDLEYMINAIKRKHPAAYHGLPDKVEKRYNEVKNEINSRENITVAELNALLESILSSLKDGHTYIAAQIADKKYLKYIDSINREKMELVKVNDIDIDSLLEKYADYYSFEAKSWEKKQLTNSLCTLDGLNYLGINIDDGIKYTFANEDKIKEIVCTNEDFLGVEAYKKYNGITDENESSEIENQFVSYTIDENNDVAILTLKSCDYNDEYINTLKEMFQQVKLKGINNVAVDLRDNGGGSSMVANEFIKYLDTDSFGGGSLKWRHGFIVLNVKPQDINNKKYNDLTFDGNVYILTNANSFSSSMLFAQYIKDNNLGKIVGEAPGNDPNGYGEIASLLLPNSKLYMSVSTKRFYRVNQDTDEFLVEPDINCKGYMAVERMLEDIANSNIKK